MLIDDGLLRSEDGHWEAVGDLSEVRVPPSIQLLLATRLDQLAAGERRVLERAAVEGNVFHLGAVEALASEEERAASPRAWPGSSARSSSARTGRRTRGRRDSVPAPVDPRRGLRRAAEARSRRPARSSTSPGSRRRRPRSRSSSATTWSRRFATGASSARSRPTTRRWAHAPAAAGLLGAARARAGRHVRGRRAARPCARSPRRGLGPRAPARARGGPQGVGSARPRRGGARRGAGAGAGVRASPGSRSPRSSSAQRSSSSAIPSRRTSCSRRSRRPSRASTSSATTVRSPSRGR